MSIKFDEIFTDQQQRLPLLPKAWGTIDPSKLLLTVPMQNLAEIATDVDLYRPFLDRVERDRLCRVEAEASIERRPSSARVEGRLPSAPVERW